MKFFTEGCSLGGDTYYFGGEDPQIIIEEIPENAEFIEIDLEFTDEKKAGQKFWQNIRTKSGSSVRSALRLNGNEKMLEVMKHSRLWRAYRKFKKI